MKLPLSSGVLAALAAYGLWGALPLVLHLLQGIEPVSVVAYRILWSVVMMAVIMTVLRRMDQIRAVMRDRKTLIRIFYAATLLSLNWLTYIWAVHNERILETSFGYFMNPLVNVAIGLFLLKEKLNRLQAVAIGIAVVAVAIQAWGIGGLPWISLWLAASFGFYGYFRKTAAVGAATGLFVEVIMLAPFSLLYALIAPHMYEPAMVQHLDLGDHALLAMMGPVTAIPLLCFAFAAKRLAMSTLGMFQYIAPTLQFLIAVYIFHEPINATQLFSFLLIWVSLAVFTYSSLRRKPVTEPV